MRDISIGDHRVGEDWPTMVVAELSANHQQRLSIALETIEAAAESGANAIKLQTYTPDSLTIKSDAEWFQLPGDSTWAGHTLHSLYSQAFTPWEWHADLFRKAQEVGLICFSSAFDDQAVDLLEELDVPAYKVASFEITDTPLIQSIASKGKPVILSTGIANLADIERALEACTSVGNTDIVLMQCNSAYPTDLRDVNLATMSDMRHRFEVQVGYSDHTLGNSAAVAATALGAVMIEKHFILDKALGGPDAHFSQSPDEFSRMVSAIREAESCMGEVTYELGSAAKLNRRFSRSLFVVEDVRKGERVNSRNVRSIRPGFGLMPSDWPNVEGKYFSRVVERGTPLDLQMLTAEPPD